MNHAEAEATGAVERYLMGDMDSGEESRFEEHYFSCGECAEDIRVSTIFLDNLQAVLREPYAVSREEGPSAPVRMPRRRWMVPASIAAGVVLSVSVAYQNFVQIPKLRREVEVANRIESPPTYYVPETRSETNTLTAPAGARRVSLMLDNIPGKSYPYYDCTLRDESGKIVRAFRVQVMPGEEQWQLPLPTEGLSSQRYTLQVRGASDASGPAAQDVAEYHFRLEFR